MSMANPSLSSDEIVLAKNAKQASLVIGALSISQRNTGLQKIYDTLVVKESEVLAANEIDMQVVLPLTALTD